ncbi:MAG: GNAT family N-acetyltransferase [Pseudomonadota bacterium]
MADVDLRRFEARDAPWLVDVHQRLYARDEGFDDSFGQLVEKALDDFLSGHDPHCEAGWIAERDGQPMGSIFCVRLHQETAKLRLFLLVPEARGQGLGKHMLETCLSFARSVGYRQLRLWTHESHRAACALYKARGFRCLSSKPVRSFGVDLVEQSWEIDL